MTIDQQFVEFIVKSLVSQPDEVVINRTIDEKGVLLELTVAPEDLGRVIGKKGATAQSIRSLLRALGTKNEARYNLKIVDNGDQSHRQSQDNSSTTSTDDTATDVVAEAEESTVVSRARQELADLDDLDV